MFGLVGDLAGFRVGVVIAMAVAKPGW